MKYARFLYVSAITALCLAGCSQNQLISTAQLSTATAQKTIDQWIKSGGKATVNGVQELPQENTARADLTISNFTFQQATGFGGVRPRTYSGPGTAIFTHYNDGRWVLSQIETNGNNEFSPATWEHINLEVSNNTK